MKTKSMAAIKVSVETHYKSKQPHPFASHYFFAYRITIKNISDYTVILKNRHWYICDSNGLKSEVAGDGVAGVQPILARGHSNQYVSGCNLITDMGKVNGIYFIER